MKHLGMFLCAVLLAVSCMAQTKAGDTAVNVPFAFSVGSQLLPAGHYIVSAVDSTHVRIDGDKQHGLYAATHGALRMNSDESKVVFHKYGDKYFLAEVWVTGKTTGREVPSSADERALVTRPEDMRLAVYQPMGSSRGARSTK